MKRLLILVEGHTEETFVDELLVPHLGALDISVDATRICTKLEKGRRQSRGGNATYGKIKNDLERLFRSKPDAVTTMIDFYRLPPGFPGMTPPPRGNFLERAAHVERAFAQDVGHPRFIPNIMMYEFEALLFSRPAVIAEVLLDDEIRTPLERVASAFGCPEEIDDGPETAPSKRIEAICGEYDKPQHGPRIAARIGLAGIRTRCPRFDAWLSRLEQL